MTRREAIARALDRWAPNAEDHEVARFEDVLRAAGFVVAPLEPTQAMIVAGCDAQDDCIDQDRDSYGVNTIVRSDAYLVIYSAMLEAAP